MSGSVSARVLCSTTQLAQNAEKNLRSAIHPTDMSLAIATAPRKGITGLCIGIPVHICGTDLNGQDFVEATSTEQITPHGAFVVLNRFLGPDQEVIIRRGVARWEINARVVGQVGIRPDGYVYGVEIAEAQSRFWGLHFPPGPVESAARAIRCSCCMSSQSAELSEIQLAVLEANGMLSWPCDECYAITFWQMVPEQEQASPGKSSERGGKSKSNRRKTVRTLIRASACLCQPTGLRDVTRLIDVSRGGISFRTRQHYSIHSWVELAAPYTEGGANIFVPGRIVWTRTASYGFKEYGVQYVRN